MRRKSLVAAGLAVLFVMLIAVGCALALRYEPNFYGNKVVEPGPLRTKNSKDFVKNLTRLIDGIYNADEKWGAAFTETQINSYFAEDFHHQGVANMLPDSISEPRIAIEKDKIRLGFRYGEAPWTTVVNMDFRVWVAPKESNAIVLQLQGLSAGAVPISSKMVIDQLTAAIRSQNRDIEVTWYRHEGKLTALVRFNGGRPRSTHRLQQINVGQGMVVISGRSTPELAQREINP